MEEAVETVMENERKLREPAVLFALNLLHSLH